MNTLATQTTQLPDTLEDLTQFVLVGKAKLQAYMLKLQTVNRLSTAQEIRDQTLKEAQEVSTALIAAEQRVGELLLAIPKQAGRPSENSSIQVEKLKTKSEIVSDMGYSKDEASDYQRMAKNPEVVQRVIEEAIANGQVVTKSRVLAEIRALTAELEEQDKKIEELKAEKTQTVQVYPPDYDDLKKKAKKADALAADLIAERRKRDEDLQAKLRLQDELDELKNASMEGLEHGSLSENVYYFCSLANNFIGNVGGLVWLTERICDMPKKEQELFLKAAHAFRDWALAFTQNLEKGELYERDSKLDAGISLLTD